MTMRSKQWYTKTSRLPNSFVNVSIGRPPRIGSRQHDHRSDDRGIQNFKYVWLELRTPTPQSSSKLNRFPRRDHQVIEGRTIENSRFRQSARICPVVVFP